MPIAYIPDDKPIIETPVEDEVQQTDDQGGDDASSSSSSSDSNSGSSTTAVMPVNLDGWKPHSGGGGRVKIISGDFAGIEGVTEEEHSADLPSPVGGDYRITERVIRVSNEGGEEIVLADSSGKFLRRFPGWSESSWKLLKNYILSSFVPAGSSKMVFQYFVIKSDGSVKRYVVDVEGISVTSYPSQNDYADYLDKLGHYVSQQNFDSDQVDEFIDEQIPESVRPKTGRSGREEKDDPTTRGLKGKSGGNTTNGGKKETSVDSHYLSG